MGLRHTKKWCLIVLMVSLLVMVMMLLVERPKIVFVSQQEQAYLGKISDVSGSITHIRTSQHQYIYYLPWFANQDEVAFFSPHNKELFDLSSTDECTTTLYFDRNKAIHGAKISSTFWCARIWL